MDGEEGTSHLRHFLYAVEMNLFYGANSLLQKFKRSLLLLYSYVLKVQFSHCLFIVEQFITEKVLIGSLEE